MAAPITSSCRLDFSTLTGGGDSWSVLMFQMLTDSCVCFLSAERQDADCWKVCFPWRSVSSPTNESVEKLWADVCVCVQARLSAAWTVCTAWTVWTVWTALLRTTASVWMFPPTFVSLFGSRSVRFTTRTSTTCWNRWDTHSRLPVRPVLLRKMSLNPKEPEAESDLSDSSHQNQTCDTSQLAWTRESVPDVCCLWEQQQQQHKYQTSNPGLKLTEVQLLKVLPVKGPNIVLSTRVHIFTVNKQLFTHLNVVPD